MSTKKSTKKTAKSASRNAKSVKTSKTTKSTKPVAKKTAKNNACAAPNKVASTIMTVFFGVAGLVVVALLIVWGCISFNG